MARNKRKKLFVDRKVQGTLLLRVVLYWIYCLAAVILLVACWSVITDKPSSSNELFRRLAVHYAPGILASFLLLPIVLWDFLRVSNRFAGPMVRVRWTLQKIAEGEDVKPLSFREGDFWQEFSEDFNAAMLKQREGQPAAAVELTDSDQTEADQSHHQTLQETPKTT